MGPQLLLDTTHLMQHVEAMGAAIRARGTCETADHPARALAEFVQCQHARFIDLGVAIGCAAFSMGVVLGVMLLLEKL